MMYKSHVPEVSCHSTDRSKRTRATRNLSGLIFQSCGYSGYINVLCFHLLSIKNSWQIKCGCMEADEAHFENLFDLKQPNS